jgi:hypothetical protein
MGTTPLLYQGRRQSLLCSLLFRVWGWGEIFCLQSMVGLTLDAFYLFYKLFNYYFLGCFDFCSIFVGFKRKKINVTE